jgi:hypothetical protein
MDLFVRRFCFLNNEMEMIVPPLLLLFILNKVLNSLRSLFNKEFHRICCRDGVSNILVGISNNPKIVLNQFWEVLRILFYGSNTENRFHISFN